MKLPYRLLAKLPHYPKPFSERHPKITSGAIKITKAFVALVLFIGTLILCTFGFYWAGLYLNKYTAEPNSHNSVPELWLSGICFVLGGMVILAGLTHILILIISACFDTANTWVNNLFKLNKKEDTK